MTLAQRNTGLHSTFEFTETDATQMNSVFVYPPRPILRRSSSDTSCGSSCDSTCERHVRFSPQVIVGETYAPLNFHTPNVEEMVYDRRTEYPLPHSPDEERQMNMEVAQLRFELFPQGDFFGDREKPAPVFDKDMLEMLSWGDEYM
eukprot:comp17012_c0_seq1/m.15692 comp17012_c0_seq1/g.15692  ORF comp17012_c0_seq1/g.15692 comp17012_c0_seq1/m.15692 type:complete len:146 (-) comp17012_c0_seq1:569-1006(-)